MGLKFGRMLAWLGAKAAGRQLVIHKRLKNSLTKQFRKQFAGRQFADRQFADRQIADRQIVG